MTQGADPDVPARQTPDQSASFLSNEDASVLTAERIGEIGAGLKPSTTSQTPSDNSHAATGKVTITDTEAWWLSPNIVADAEATSRGAPIARARE